MFTTGSKLFLGATAVSTATALVVALSQGGSRGLGGTVALVAVALAFALLAGINFAIRDGNVPAMHDDATITSAAAQPAPANSVWPLVAGLSGLAMVIGAETRPIVFKGGVVLALVAGAEWMVHNWSDRASADAAYNAAIRKRTLHPLEFPVVAAAGLGVLIYAFSRIMLWIDKGAGPAVFIVAGALVLAGGAIFALRPPTKKGVSTGVVAIAALGVVGAGAAMAFDGQRDIERHPTVVSQPTACNAPDEQGELDEKDSQAVAAKSNLAAEITLSGEALHATQPGRKITGPLTFAKGSTVNVLFHNDSDEPRRLTVYLGKLPNANGEPQAVSHCTTMVEPGGQQFMSFKAAKASAAVLDGPMQFMVPGVEGAELEVVVP